MVELKEKTVEELRKMASRKKIEGRSKMNKEELVKALKKKTSTKKTVKRRRIRGGAIDNEQVESLLTRNYETDPLYLVEISYDIVSGRPIRRNPEPIYVTIRKVIGFTRYQFNPQMLMVRTYSIIGERNNITLRNIRWRHGRSYEGNIRVMRESNSPSLPYRLYLSNDNRFLIISDLLSGENGRQIGRDDVQGSLDEVAQIIFSRLHMLPDILSKCLHVSIPLNANSPLEIIESFDNEVGEEVNILQPQA